MTIPQNVKDAVAQLDNAMMFHADDLSYASWTAIRAHLMSQDAEIERMKKDSLGGQFDYIALRDRLDLAESRLAAANERLEATERTLERCKQTLDTTSEGWRLDAERLEAANALLRTIAAYTPPAHECERGCPKETCEACKLAKYLQGAGDEA